MGIYDLLLTPCCKHKRKNLIAKHAVHTWNLKSETKQPLGIKILTFCNVIKAMQFSKNVV